MSMSPRLGVRQTQQLVMTPELRQSIKLLQLTTGELQTFINAEIEKNPLLEQSSLDEGVIETPPKLDNREILDRQFSKNDLFDAQSAFDVGAENLTEVFSDRLAPMRGQAGAPDQVQGGFAENIAGPRTLKDSLRSQIGMMSLETLTMSVAMILVDELDDDGYFRADFAELSDRLGVETEALENGLAVLQTCDPTGVAARNLSECMALQARDRGIFDTDMAAVLDHLDDLAHVTNVQFAKTRDLSPARLTEILHTIRELNPAPGMIFDSGHAEMAVPEVQVTRDNLGGWHVELNADTLPKLLINNQYAAYVGGENQETTEFITNCTARARWLVNSLDQRAKTILRVAAEIVKQQDDFFTRGVSALRPMTLRDVAEKVDVHESTVSRVTAGKYLICSRGTFELKFFFSSSVKGKDGAKAQSSRSVQERIRQLIDTEDPKKTLSDDGIVRALESDGINIARRTVTKYREAMRIPSSVQRRRRKASYKNTLHD